MNSSILCIRLDSSFRFLSLSSFVSSFSQLNIPRIEDGNNFGVSVQEEVLNELTRSEDSAFGALDSATKYFVSRGKLISKVFSFFFFLNG